MISVKKSTRFVAICAGAPLLALAVGTPTAWATPSGNGATVSIGGTIHGSPNSTSIAQATPGNKAVAVNHSIATAAGGTGNTALAVNNSSAEVLNAPPIGSNNTATAINDSVVLLVARGSASNNTATATCGAHVFVNTLNSGQTFSGKGSACGN